MIDWHTVLKGKTPGHVLGLNKKQINFNDSDLDGEVPASQSSSFLGGTLIQIIE